MSSSDPEDYEIIPKDGEEEQAEDVPDNASHRLKKEGKTKKYIF